jgi:hypothetical protein
MSFALISLGGGEGLLGADGGGEDRCGDGRTNEADLLPEYIGDMALE